MDGFIARENGDLDWLEVQGDARGEDYGYNAFVGEIDAVVMGRKTFEKVLTFKAWPFGKTAVVVLSTRPLRIPPKLLGSVETMADRPSEVVDRLARAGLRRLYLDGGYTIQGFLRAGLVDQITVTRVPVLLGRGVPLFGALPSDVRLRHVETRQFRSGLVQSTYAVMRKGRARGPRSRPAKVSEGGKTTSLADVLEAGTAGSVPQIPYPGEDLPPESIAEDSHPEPPTEDLRPDPMTEDSPPAPLDEDSQPELQTEDSRYEPTREDSPPAPTTENSQPEPGTGDLQLETKIEDSPPERTIEERPNDNREAGPPGDPRHPKRASDPLVGADPAPAPSDDPSSDEE